MKLSRCVAILGCFAVLCYSQSDPGPRPGPAGAGGAYPELNSDELAFFTQALERFQEVNAVDGGPEPGDGLGPRFNGNSCAGCHIQPEIGGSSPSPTSPQKPLANPQVALATLDGATNTVPPFITANGPIREVRFRSDSGVHDLFTLTGRSDAPGCTLTQPDFSNSGNISFRIPTPLFGLGLVENTSDGTLQANLAANAPAKRGKGIHGRFNQLFNLSGNDGTITKFGWKAQNKSLRIFAGEAYNVEQGVTNEIFPNERDTTPGCQFNATPEDPTNIITGTASEVLSDTDNFAVFMRLSAPPTPTTATASELNGQTVFTSVGCNLCHSPSLTTSASPFTGMSNVVYHPYSDFALHEMGKNLEDGISQGSATGRQFRTAPLWGIGQRIFFLHDGRTSDLLNAIRGHAGPQSEANVVVDQFNHLTVQQQQDILAFLRSL